MKKITLIASLLILSLTSCSNKTNYIEQQATTTEQLTNNSKKISTPEQKANIAPKPLNKLPQKLKQRKIITQQFKKNNVTAINGRKFTLTSGNITAGAIVFDMLMREYGTVKGSIVVVTKTELKIQNIPVQRIANNTYRLTPPSNVLASTYRALAKDAKYKQVELEIDYSPIYIRQKQKLIYKY